MVGRAAREDAREWLELVAGVADNFPGLDMADYARTLDKNIDRGTALVAREDGRLAGVLLFSPRQMCLSFMAVRPECRRRGVGRALVGEMLRLMPPGDVSVTTFRAGDPLAAAPRALYLSLGFEPRELMREFGYPVQRMVLPGGSRG